MIDEQAACKRIAVEGVRREDDGSLRPRWGFLRPENPLLELPAHPIGAAGVGMPCLTFEQGEGLRATPHGNQGHDKLGRLGDRHPWLMRYASAPASGLHEPVPVRVQPPSCARPV